MKTLRHPGWIFLVNSLPLVLLALILASDYKVISSLLSDDSKIIWVTFAVSMGVLWLLNVAYAAILLRLHRRVSSGYALISLSAWITWLYLYVVHLETMFPVAIPQWMVSENAMLYAGTFLMPTLVYALMILVLAFSSGEKDYPAWKSFLLALLIPAIFFLFSQVIAPMWQPVSDHFSIHGVIVLMIIGTVLFLFFVIRALYLLLVRKGEQWRKYELAWKIPISLILPLIGLLVNNGILWKELGEEGVFGNFNSFWFYLLAIMNGLVICLPQINHFGYRLILFLFRSGTFAFTFYFFLVFIPFLPLSVFAIIFFGSGFLMLTPLLLFVIHADALGKDYHFLKGRLQGLTLWALALAAFIIIPSIITINNYRDKRILREAMTYIYTPDYNSSVDFDPAPLEKSLKALKQNRRGQGFFSGNSIPYLSSWYRRIVFDNLTLSDSKINAIERVFFDKNAVDPDLESPLQNQKVSISDIEVVSRYDEKGAHWVSQMDLQITNSDSSDQFSEYATRFVLPDGCWISDYHLYVGDRREAGILSEKRSAMWVFSQIRNVKKDPGLLYYETGNTIVFRVFPFLAGEVRKTGIEFVHLEPVTFEFDGHTVRLGDPASYGRKPDKRLIPKGLAWISADQKGSLKEVYRKPYFHFIADVSKSDKKLITGHIVQIEEMIRKNPEAGKGAKVSLVNSAVRTMTIESDWKREYHAQPSAGGFFLDRAIRKILLDAWNEHSERYPVIVVLSDQLEKAIVFENFADLRFTFPESAHFYHLTASNELFAHSLLSAPLTPLPDSPAIEMEKPVLAWNTAEGEVLYLAANNRSELVPTGFNTVVPEQRDSINGIHTALYQHATWISTILHPEKINSIWQDLVQQSFKSGIMSPVTAYIVVETEAQKAALLRKQKEALAGNPLMDLSESVQSMPEPGVIVLVIMLLFIVSRAAIAHRRRKSRTFEISAHQKE